MICSKEGQNSFSFCFDEEKEDIVTKNEKRR